MLKNYIINISIFLIAIHMLFGCNYSPDKKTTSISDKDTVESNGLIEFIPSSYTFYYSCKEKDCVVYSQSQREVNANNGYAMFFKKHSTQANSKCKGKYEIDVDLKFPDGERFKFNQSCKWLSKQYKDSFELMLPAIDVLKVVEKKDGGLEYMHDINHTHNHDLLIKFYAISNTLLVNQVSSVDEFKCKDFSDTDSEVETFYKCMEFRIDDGLHEVHNRTHGGGISP